MLSSINIHGVIRIEIKKEEKVCDTCWNRVLIYSTDSTIPFEITCFKGSTVTDSIEIKNECNND